MTARKPHEEDRIGSICSALHKAIIEQALKPGTKLPEDTLGERFGVSRTIARHALGQLAAEGLVELRRNRGAVVATPSRSSETTTGRPIRLMPRLGDRRTAHAARPGRAPRARPRWQPP